MSLLTGDGATSDGSVFSDFARKSDLILSIMLIARSGVKLPKGNVPAIMRSFTRSNFFCCCLLSDNPDKSLTNFSSNTAATFGVAAGASELFDGSDSPSGFRGEATAGGFSSLLVTLGAGATGACVGGVSSGLDTCSPGLRFLVPSFLVADSARNTCISEGAALYSFALES